MVDYSGLENRRAERHRGFESLSLRKQGCKSMSYVIYTLYYTQKVSRYFLYGLLGSVSRSNNPSLILAILSAGVSRERNGFSKDKSGEKFAE